MHKTYKFLMSTHTLLMGAEAQCNNHTKKPPKNNVSDIQVMSRYVKYFETKTKQTPEYSYEKLCHIELLKYITVDAGSKTPRQDAQIYQARLAFLACYYI